MNKSFQIVFAAVVILVIVILYWTRFQVVPANYAYAPAFYKINRITGEVILTVGKEFVAVEGIEAKKPSEAPPPAPAPSPKPSPQPAPAPTAPSK
ncbi:MAG: hypothetical protein ACE14T_03090 [Syntrophales bacterium]